MRRQYKIGIVAGELSGDSLGAGLMAGLKQLYPEVGFVFIGIGGPKMRSFGLIDLEDMEKLAMNGFREPIVRLPYLLSLFRRLLKRFDFEEIDAFLGVDFNVFNFLIEGRLKRKGIPTAHYVSPSVYAWRPGRVEKIAKSTDLLLCLFPFEPKFYDGVSIDVRFVGHPLADEIPSDVNPLRAKTEARDSLNLCDEGKVVALLPGSRRGEIFYMLDTFLRTAEIVKRELTDVRFIIPCVNEEILCKVDDYLKKKKGLKVVTYLGNANTALLACDVVLTKSGTSTLEASLLKRPMVVAYKIGRLTYHLAYRFMKTEFFALPNIILNRLVVPEFIQEEASPESLAQALLTELERFSGDPDYLGSFQELHRQLRKNSNEESAKVFFSFLSKKGSKN